MSESSPRNHKPDGSPFEPRASSLLSSSDATPREEPYLEPSHLNKPILDLYEPESVNDHVHLEEPGNAWAWILADKQDFVDVEAHR